MLIIDRSQSLHRDVTDEFQLIITLRKITHT